MIWARVQTLGPDCRPARRRVGQRRAPSLSMKARVCIEIENADLVGNPRAGKPLMRYLHPKHAIRALEADVVLYQGEIVANRHGATTVKFPKVIRP